MSIKFRNLHPDLQNAILFKGEAGMESRGANGPVYYVDLNVADDTGDGLTWDTAMQTVARAVTELDAQMGASANRIWAKRGTIYVCGDGIAEALVAMPEKSDIVGVGTDVGSFPKITGNCTIATAVVGTRLINLGFIPTATDPVMTFPTGMHGFELHGVRLYKTEAVLNDAGILATNCRDFVMKDVHVYPDVGGARMTLGLSLVGATIGRARIEDCYFEGVEALDLNSNITDGKGSVCLRTLFKATNLCIDDNSDEMMFIDCRLITDAAAGDANGVNIVDWDATKVCGNEATSADSFGPIPNLDALS